MELDFSRHKLDHISQILEYKETLGKDTFFRFLDVVYGMLLKMNFGDEINIAANSKITTKNRDFFIKAVELFIQEGNSNYKFSNNYTRVVCFDSALKITEEITEVKEIFAQIEVKRLKLRSICNNQENVL
ncbi:MAG: hypothetical protein E6772_16815 [Dysgonomonas sp.]|nr:hypothetical protein [Dysgonomonas sp.]